MFQNQRYVTRGVNSEIPSWIQIALWIMIDSLEIQKDWLQVFQLISNKETVKIVQSQEEPEFSQEIEVPLCGQKLVNAKVYVIDDGDHSTMLLAEEY